MSRQTVKGLKHHAPDLDLEAHKIGTRGARDLNFFLNDHHE